MRYKPSSSSKSKWSVEQVPLAQIKLDAVECQFKEPIDKYDLRVSADTADDCVNGIPNGNGNKNQT